MRETDAISRSAALKVGNVRQVTEYDEAGYSVIYNAVPVDVIEALPALDVAPVVHARWNLSLTPMPTKVTYDGWMHCPKCRESFRRIVGTQLFKHCPNCSAQMDGEADG